ncbi:hypothetical protein VTO73DRAFT_7745 [Trametes versicolor]
MYAVALFPAHPLQVGDAVHLHLLCPPSHGLGRAVAIPLEIKGRISGERERSELEVEFVVSNDEEETCVRRAFIRASADPRMSATPTPPAERLRVRPSNPYDEQEAQPRSTRAERNLDANLGARAAAPGLAAHQAHLHRQLGTDRGRWVVCTPSRMETERLEARRVGVSNVAPGPGPTQKVRPAWLAPRPTRVRRSRMGTLLPHIPLPI